MELNEINSNTRGKEFLKFMGQTGHDLKFRVTRLFFPLFLIEALTDGAK